MKTFLIAVSGMSPAIVTETLWALACEIPPTIPDEVIVITTLKGETDIREQLLSPLADWNNKTVWENLRHDIFAKAGTAESSAALQLSIRVIELPDRATGIRSKAADIRSGADNAEAADFILQTLGSITHSEDHHVVASIAGGRKTMGGLLYASMNLVGRESHRVTHVLVDEKFETTRGFFYPKQPVQILKSFNTATRETSDVLADDAKIELADIPFIPLRNGFKEMKEKALSFSGLVHRYTHELATPQGDIKLSFDEIARTLTAEGRSINLSGRGLLVAMFAMKRLAENGEPFRDLTHAEPEFIKFYNELSASDREHPAIARIMQTPDRSNISAGIEEIRRKFREKNLPAAIIHALLKRGTGFNTAPL